MEEKHRGAVSRMMSNKKDCKQQDTPNDTELAFFEVVLSDFESPYYICQTLQHDWYEQLTDQDNWDSSNPEIMTKGRTAKWISETWYNYVQPKYQKYLGCWNKETGGGDRTPPSFQNYCDGNDTWLAWIFCLDHEQNFILASNASSWLPSHLTKEGGFGENGGEAQNGDSARAHATGGATGGGRVITNQKIEASIKNQQATAAFINSAIGEV
jgi:hypothetical protein